MRVVILAHGTTGAGGRSVAKNLIASLGRVAPEHTYGIIIPAGLGFEEICESVPNCEVFTYENKAGQIGRWLWETFRLPKIVRDFRPDVILSLADRGLVNPPAPQAVLIHRSQLFYPAKHYANDTFKNKLLFKYHSRHLAKSLKHTHLLLCQTAAAQERLRRTYGFQGRIEICPNAVSAFVAVPSDVRKPPDALTPYADHMKLFCLTRYYAHKNLEGIVDLFRKFGREMEKVLIITTVEAGGHPKAAKFLRSIKEPGIREHILNVGLLPQSTLAGYYKNCNAMFLPTFLESFSGTYLEAMHFGVPILTSDLDFAHVVCGDAALYFDPWNTESIKDAILQLKNNSELAQSLVVRGKARLQTMFKSWDEISTELIAQLVEIAENPDC